MRAIVRTLIASFAVAGAVAVQSALPFSPASSAQPYISAAAEVNATPPISWSQLGLSDQMDLVGANQSVGTSVPVPQGATPIAVSGLLGSVVNLGAGRVDVLDSRGILLGSIPIPAGVATAPFTIDTSRAEVINGVAKLSFAIHDDSPPVSGCVPPAGVTLSQLAMSYSGETVSPRTVADFLPGYLDNITIRVGPNPSAAVQQATLSLVAKLTALYRPIPVAISVDTSETAWLAGSSGISRVIELRDGGEPRIAVENGGTSAAVLVVTGRGDSLVNQVELFSDRRMTLAQTPAAAVKSVSDNLEQASQVLTFGQLGVSAEASVLGTTTTYAGFDASKFAVGSIQGAKVRLLAHYTAVRDGEASLLVRSGSNVLASTPLDDSGAVDLTVDIPAQAVSSNVGLGLEVRYVSAGECTTPDRMTFVVDPDSTVTVFPGTKNRGGFAALPMAFTPDFDVAIENPAQIRFAAEAIRLMGQQTSVALRPRLRRLEEAVHSGTGLLTVTGADRLGQLGLNPPISPGAGTIDTIDGTPVTEVDVNGPLGVVQAFKQNDRMVLALSSSGDDSLLDRSLGYIDGLKGRWGALGGDVVATGAAGPTAGLTVRAGGYLPPHAPPSDEVRLWAMATAAVGVIVAIAVITTIVVRRRRSGT